MYLWRTCPSGVIRWPAPCLTSLICWTASQAQARRCHLVPDGILPCLRLLHTAGLRLQHASILCMAVAMNFLGCLLQVTAALHCSEIPVALHGRCLLL